MSAAIVVAAFVVGAAFGSFANVLIHRLPRGESIVSPPSHCPSCRAPIAPWDNVPILSFLLLGGGAGAAAQPSRPDTCSWR